MTAEIFTAGCAGIGFLISCFIKEDLRRQKMEFALAGRGLSIFKKTFVSSLNIPKLYAIKTWILK